MTPRDLNQRWSEFLSAWPPERIRQMTLEEYTNPSKNDSLIYWLETRLDQLGSILGGSAFKFGIYHQTNIKTKQTSAGRAWGTIYAWLSKFGPSEQEAFATVRSRLADVLDAIGNRNLARIDEIDLPPVLKWKIAFLYQDREAPSLFPVFKKEALFNSYRDIDPRARLGTTPYHVMYETLLERHRSAGDVFDISHQLWNAYEKQRDQVSQAWAVPLAWAIQDPAVVDTFCQKASIEAEDIDSFLNNLLAAADMSEGDVVAFLVDGDVRALGKMACVEPGHFSWDQTPVNFPSGLLVNPTSEVRKLDAAERANIWNQAPEEAVQAAGEKPPFSCWKVSAETDGSLWPQWRDEGFVSIGWERLGDLSNLDEATYIARRDKIAAEEPVTHSAAKLEQVWRFHAIPVGARIVANHGTTRVFGIGTVTSSYYFVGGDDYPHRLKVRWDDITEKKVNFSHWRSTLIRVNAQDFEKILSGAVTAGTPVPESTETSAVRAASAENATPCKPQNVILYGPPGTGKTYSTVRRALELILGPEKLFGLGENGLTALFREHQARGQIEFVTFHQAYGYEEFVEGIRPVLEQVGEGGVGYELHNGVFKRIALRAATEGLRIETTQPEFEELWDSLIRQLQDEDGRIVTGQGGKSYCLEVSSRGNILVRNCDVDSEGNVTHESDTKLTASRENTRLYWKHRAELGPEPEKLTYEKTTTMLAREKGGGGGNHYTALWLVYNELFAMERTFSPRRTDPADRIARVQQALDKPGPTTTFSFSANSPQYVLIVDEINRGNMSKILGELITLLETDKRLASRNELKLPLLYSPQHRFAVPPNLHVLGTMNTADRSIALMDVALRRRFTFEELMPDTDVIRTALRADVPSKAFIQLVTDVFETLNDRIRFLYDRDHQLGHSYFLEVKTPDALRLVFINRIIPMLQEYFYGAWSKINIVLGCPFGDAGEPRRREQHLLVAGDAGKPYANAIITARSFTEVKTLGFDHDDYEDRVDYLVRGKFVDGSLSEEELFRTFLGILAIDSSTFEQRLSELLEQAERIRSSGDVRR